MSLDASARVICEAGHHNRLGCKLSCEPGRCENTAFSVQPRYLNPLETHLRELWESRLSK